MARSSADVVIEGASVSYRRFLRARRVLSDIDFSARPGEVTAIIGPNGAGKTTLFRTLMGFLALDRGQCLIGGLPPEEYRQAVGIGYQPETVELPAQWNARDLLGRGVDLSGIADEERPAAFRKALARTRFDDATLARPARRYSKGMKRRLVLAFALIGEPAVLLLDEPFSGLDPPARHALRVEIVEARARGAVVVLASHELAEVERLANRAFILEGGHLRAGPNPTPADGAMGTRLESELTGQPELTGRGR